MNWGSLVAEQNAVWIAAVAITVAVVVGAAVFIVPSRAIPAERRRYGAPATPSLLTQAADASTGFVGRVVGQKGGAESAAHALDLAGIRRSVPEFILLVGASALAAAASGFVLGGVIVATMLSGLVVAGALMFVNFRAGKRRADFADQLDDLVQLLASNLRAGHSVLQAMDSITQELDEPGASEIARVVNQVRVGRDLGEALEETAERMDSDDFRWIAQAIAIHRQVGGNLAEVMDTVGETIRERNQIRRQVAALSAEGKMSAYVLGALPFGVALLLQIISPDHMARFTQSVLGYFMLFVAFLLLALGSFWLSRIVKIKF